MTSTISGRIYDRLRAEIVDAILPPGLKLRIDDLCRRYQVTSTPVREALNKLTAEHLVVRHDQRGFSIPTADLADLAELTRTRCWVEAIALRESIQQRTDSWRTHVLDTLNVLTTTERSTSAATFQENPDWEGAHRAFHLALIANCPSRRMIGFCGQLADQATRYRRLAMKAVFPHRDVSREHLAIAEATVQGDADAAVAALLRHYGHTADIVAQTGLSGTDPNTLRDGAP